MCGHFDVDLLHAEKSRFWMKKDCLRNVPAEKTFIFKDFINMISQNTYFVTVCLNKIPQIKNFTDIKWLLAFLHFSFQLMFLMHQK